MQIFKKIKYLTVICLALLNAGCVVGGVNATLGIILGLAAISGLSSIGGGGGDSGGSSAAVNPPTPPAPVRDFTVKSYDGNSDDLLTAGLGQTGLRTSTITFADASNPTAAELRRAAIVSSYQAAQDMRTESGYGRLYGAAVPTRFVSPPSEGKVAGKEFVMFDSSGLRVTMLVQVPSQFDRQRPCIVAAPATGSRGIYGAIGSVGEWGLKSRCAVAYTDKGAGVGLHDLASDTVNKIDGVRTTVSDAGDRANFVATGSAQLDIAAYSSAFPNRVALKHAHSQQNPEAQWGAHVLNSIDFAFRVLNLTDEFGQVTTLTASNTLVIAAGVSSGAAAALQAAEQDTRGLIDGVVVAAPLMSPRFLTGGSGFVIRQGTRSTVGVATTQTVTVSTYGKNLLDALTYYHLYQPCAGGTGFAGGSAGRCTALNNLGLLNGLTLAAQATEAQRLLLNFGALAGTQALAGLYAAESLYAGLSVVYANAYGRFSVADNVCGYSYAATVGTQVPRALGLSELADEFATNTGVPPVNGINLINNTGNQGRGVNYLNSVDAAGNLEQYTAGALCLRRLQTGTTGVFSATGTPLVGDALQQFNRVQGGALNATLTGDLRNKPTIIVHGRDDALAHVNFTSRAYVGLNKTVGGFTSPIRYIEVQNAHHFDVLNQRYNLFTQIPLHYYFSQALDAMYGHLVNRTALPDSQVIPTEPTGAAGGRLVVNLNLPDFGSAVTCPIEWDDGVLDVPLCARDLF